MLRVVFDGKHFVAHVSHRKGERKAKAAGFRYSMSSRRWYTPFHAVAARLSEYADDRAKDEIRKTLITVSHWSRPLQLPRGLALKYFQPRPIKFALRRNRSYLALDPGLGKTVCAATVAYNLPGHRVIYVCPPFLTLNTEEEFKKWAPTRKVLVVSSKTDFKDAELILRHDVIIVPDSILTRKEVRQFMMWQYAASRRVLLIVDEVHRFKEPRAQRTGVVFGRHLGKHGIARHGLTGLADKSIIMSGTPMPNSPIELYHTLSRMAPECIDFMTKHQFGVRYCAAKRGFHGWDYSGESNVEELSERIKHRTGKFMYRLRKDVLDLPKKLEGMVIVGKDMSPKLAKLDAKIMREYSLKDLMRAEIAERHGKYETELHFMTYRRLLGIEKVPFAVDYVANILDQNQQSVLLFAIHKEVIALLQEKLYNFRPITITGKTPKAKRHALVKKFQTSKKRRLFIGQLTAAGIGLTLTKATRVVMAEYSYAPSANEQAGDRAHRIGQTEDVLQEYIVFRNSGDRSVIENFLRKRNATLLI